MVEFVLDVEFAATCMRCRADVDLDALRGCDRVLKPGDPEVWVVEKPNACARCGGSRVRVEMTNE